MKRICFIIPILLLSVLVSSCHKEVKRLDTLRNRPNLVEPYCLMTGFSFGFSGDKIIIYQPSEQVEYVNQKEMIEKYDDTHYNKGRLPYSYAALVNDFTGIEVISDTEFNELAAGEKLNSKIRFQALSPYKWLISKGEDEYDWGDKAYTGKYRIPEYHQVDKPLQDIAPEDLMLLAPGSVNLVFTETPAAHYHTLTVKITDRDSTFTATKEVCFQ